MKKVALFDNSFSFRGTTRALIDYAWIIKEELGWSCDIIYNIDSKYNSTKFLKYCLKQNWPFMIKGIRDPYDEFGMSELSQYEHIYFETVGIDKNQRRFLDKYMGTMLLHQIGNEQPYQAKNKRIKSYYCSYWQSFYFTGGKSPVLPYLIDKDYLTRSDNSQDLRRNIGINKKEIVLGRHGGQDTWNLPFVNNVLVEIAQERNDLWFIYVNTPRFTDHPRFIFMDTLVERREIITYINACDAMIHSRWEGETFGLACAEFLINKKPIITWSGSRERSHIYFADKSVIMYNNECDLKALLKKITKQQISSHADQINLNLFDSCSKHNIADKFRKVFG